MLRCSIICTLLKWLEFHATALEQQERDAKAAASTTIATHEQHTDAALDAPQQTNNSRAPATPCPVAYAPLEDSLGDAPWASACFGALQQLAALPPTANVGSGSAVGTGRNAGGGISNTASATGTTATAASFSQWQGPDSSHPPQKATATASSTTTSSATTKPAGSALDTGMLDMSAFGSMLGDFAGPPDNSGADDSGTDDQSGMPQQEGPQQQASSNPSEHVDPLATGALNMSAVGGMFGEDFGGQFQPEPHQPATSTQGPSQPGLQSAPSTSTHQQAGASSSQAVGSSKPAVDAVHTGILDMSAFGMAFDMDPPQQPPDAAAQPGAETTAAAADTSQAAAPTSGRQASTLDTGMLDMSAFAGMLDMGAFGMGDVPASPAPPAPPPPPQPPSNSTASAGSVSTDDMPLAALKVLRKQADAAAAAQQQSQLSAQGSNSNQGSVPPQPAMMVAPVVPPGHVLFPRVLAPASGNQTSTAPGLKVSGLAGVQGAAGSSALGLFRAGSSASAAVNGQSAVDAGSGGPATGGLASMLLSRSELQSLQRLLDVRAEVPTDAQGGLQEQADILLGHSNTRWPSSPLWPTHNGRAHVPQTPALLSTLPSQLFTPGMCTYVQARQCPSRSQREAQGTGWSAPRTHCSQGCPRTCR
jgi:hypothetical protein